MTPTTSNPHLAVLLDGPGSHPAAWQDAVSSLVGSQNSAPDPAVLVARLREAETRGFAFALLDDSYTPRNPDQSDALRFDAVAAAAFAGPQTTSIGLVPAVPVTYTEPYHISKAIATLDYISHGRAGWSPYATARPADARYAGRDEPPAATALLGWALEHVEATRQLWDSWEDDAIIRDVAAGRFIDSDKLHHIDFKGEYLSVRGPSTTPRPPQGHPLTVVIADSDANIAVAAQSADVIVTYPATVEEGAELHADLRERVRAERAVTPWRGTEVLIFPAVGVYLDTEKASGEQRRSQLEQIATWDTCRPGFAIAGSQRHISDQLQQWARAADADGFLIVPPVVDEILPAWIGPLRQSPPPARSLRERLALRRPGNRFVVRA